MKISRTGIMLAGARTLAAGLALTLALPGAATARDLRIATGTASKNGLNSGVALFAEKLTEFSGGKYPSEVYPGGHWRFWQYTGTGLVPGIEGEVDINVFGGSVQDWQEWRRPVITPPS